MAKKKSGEAVPSQVKHDEFVAYVVEELKAKGRRLLFVDGQWYEYKSGAWAPWTSAQRHSFETTLHRLASLREFPYSTAHAAIWRTLSAALGREDVVEFDREPMLVCNNGTYFLTADRLRKHSPDHYATRRINIEVDPDAECPGWLAMLERMFEDYSATGRQENIQFLKEWMGIAIVGAANVSRDLRKGVFLYGEKRTGKSSVADVLVRLLGGDDCIASSSLTALSTRFGLEPLIGKAALITSEAANTRTEADSNILKCLITGDLQNADRKNQPPVPFRFHGPVVFTTNTLPKVSEETGALYDRFVVLEFNRQFTEDDVVETLEGHKDAITYLEATGQLPGILNWALEGYEDAVARKRFTLPSTAASATDKFRRQNDRTYDFLRSCVEYDKRYACSSDAVSIACVEYVQSTHDARISMAAAARAIARQIRSVVPGVMHEQGYKDGSQFKSYGRMRLNKLGLECLEMAKGKPYPTLKTALTRLNYKYG